MNAHTIEATLELDTTQFKKELEEFSDSLKVIKKEANKSKSVRGYLRMRYQIWGFQRQMRRWKHRVKKLLPEHTTLRIKN